MHRGATRLFVCCSWIAVSALVPSAPLFAGAAFPSSSLRFRLSWSSSSSLPSSCSSRSSSPAAAAAANPAASPRRTPSWLLRLPAASTSIITALRMAPSYTPPPENNRVAKSKTSGDHRRLPAPKPRIGDVVRYYDVDGGRADGQVLVGKISLIQPIATTSTTTAASSSDGTNKWLVEITELEDVGDGYYAEYPSRRRRKTTLRKLEDVAPLPASYVRSQDAFKVPTERSSGTRHRRPLPSHDRYDLADYQGPTASNSVPIDDDVVQADGENYRRIKLDLLKNAAMAGAAGAVGVDLFCGTEIAVIYAAGAFAGVAYLYFLGIKTDTTLGTTNSSQRIGSIVSNLRFVFPAVVVGGVAIHNAMRGDYYSADLASSSSSSSSSSSGAVVASFSTVAPEQFGAAMIGFLTYRLPLFVSQLSPLVVVATDAAAPSDAMLLPGSAAAMALRMAAADATKRGVKTMSSPDNNSLSSMGNNDDLVTVLLVSGPEGTGKTTLVDKLLEQDSRFVRPIFIDRISDAVKFERLERRGELLDVDSTGRYALSREGVLEAAATATATTTTSERIDGEGEDVPEKVVVVDADVNLARKLVNNLSGARLIGVWIGLDDLDKFESRWKKKIASGGIPIPSDETEDSLLRAKLRQVVKDIEFGVVSGVFEFTILNEDIDESMKQLNDAASYCFK